MNNVADDGMNRLEVRITELSPTEWRICDRSIAGGEASAVLGFIQQVEGAFEVTHLGLLRERTYYASFERAAASFAGRVVMS
ncbi:hypothetical protein SAMN05216282_10882 [Cryobacterium psychrotolerans]|uniref:Uncharacterized protein n=1 Tax=Cryobacterium psychrotolerans TaxID=386301 RepID=A0A1G9D5B5_9MICO|nr:MULTISPECIES: hypothetical protein [Cryobacterium]TFD41410.1 hypothetical protein E3T33_13980 [Cryobacterium sp. TMT1-2-1]TFD90288.1 hypothetical protein E3T56_01870 [Cryobacterium psychrotolerans]SDK59119.1 hypothetical protein SAMN05216282_10882 [Cryobacterium psychrotolerans]